MKLLVYLLVQLIFTAVVVCLTSWVWFASGWPVWIRTIAVILMSLAWFIGGLVYLGHALGREHL